VTARWPCTLAAALLLLGAAPSGIGPATPSTSQPPLLVTVGETTSAHARLWVRVEADEARVDVGPADGGARRTLRARPDPGRDFTAVVELDDLRAGARYSYEVEAGGARVTGAFTVAPPRDADRAVRLHWSGDLGGAGYCRDAEDGYPIFRAMVRRAPDLFLFVGDTIYADQRCGGAPHVPMPAPSPDALGAFRVKHRYNRADAALQHFFRATSVYSIWDDHEVRNNFAGPAEPLMPDGQRAFQEYFPIVGPPEEPGRLYRSVRWGRHVEVFILDTRQYRSPNWTPDGPRKTMLGPAQRRWLLDSVAMSDATWKLIVSSVPLGIFTGGRFADSWSSANVLGYPRNGGTGFVHERDLLLAELHSGGARNVVFLSGDVHHAEFLRHEPVPGHVVHELIAGPLSARQGYPRFMDRSLNSRSLASLGFALNFGELVADATTLTARIIDPSGAIRGRATIAADRSSATASAPSSPPHVGGVNESLGTHDRHAEPMTADDLIAPAEPHLSRTGHPRFQHRQSAGPATAAPSRRPQTE
jgi:alkaline phosphatase D